MAEARDRTWSNPSLAASHPGQLQQPFSPEGLGLQLSEAGVAEIAESDLDYAFQLQLEEALKDSLHSRPAEEQITQVPPAEEPSQVHTALQLQVLCSCQPASAERASAISKLRQVQLLACQTCVPA